MDIGFSTNIISSENKPPSITRDKLKQNFSEELLTTRETSDMGMTTIFPPGKKAERNTLCRLWENLTIEQFNVKTDGFVSEVWMKSKPELLLRMIIDGEFNPSLVYYFGFSNQLSYLTNT